MKSKDGLLSTSNPDNFDCIDVYNQVCDEQEQKKQAYIKELREQGFKAQHPNDGWVNREEKYFELGYPSFNDGIDINDKVMLSFGKEDNERPVKITSIALAMLGGKRYYFKDL